ncbi:type II toxin-antitoxin system RelE family toxin [Curtobacterium sp. SP.BCp]|uniref:type II toxin-antitoxin system RelE family toxin n=1 Tax=unclassified Curtobacterium TaxID=257496 RepID=UPI0025B53BBB|nr:type II toxin-antitoxin system RelE/ParE family toxin [Curtobacterium sp. 458]WJX98635.1 type II toxin-antitoxin system RelE/ParE family toxin [Curtobacterium sp. 458]
MPDPAPQQYAVELTKRAAETLGKLDRPTQRRILAALVLLQSNPRPPGMTALVGRPGELRVRVGDHRIVYEIVDDRLVVLVLTIGHRRDVYRSS